MSDRFDPNASEPERYSPGWWILAIYLTLSVVVVGAAILGTLGL